ncbi:MAG: hypothetical protein KDC67_09690, partial [Ignavibacteriae bacterium]|nr:hypothetical protein [Ignavibacteriota bacterium]
MDSRKYIKKLINSEVVIIMMFSALLFSCGEKVESGKTQMIQFPSPMVENTRAHQRIEKKDIPGFTYILNSILSKPVEVYYTDSLVQTDEEFDLIIHFHGASYIPKYAAYNSEHSFIVAIVNLGSGSSVYENEFLDNSNFTNLVKSLSDTVASKGKIKISKIYISSFSAGYGAVRALLNQNFSIIDGIILLDGLHTDYIPERKTLALGGKLNSIKLQ